MNGLTEHQLSALRAKLEADLREWDGVLQSSDGFGLQASLRESVGDLSAYDNHPADAATESYERGKDSALREHFRLLRQDASEALARMDRGEYGICAVCGRAIPYERLEANPAAAYCVEHNPAQRHSERRPAEESFLERPFGRTSMDDRDGQNGFDGEDAWQIVEAWGNSDSPAMAESPDTFDYDSGSATEGDEPDGYVETLESFLATDIYGKHTHVVRNRAYREYLEHGEGEGLLILDADDADPYP
ncbi:TraR/DksA C4-type zinc finger protein [Paenibacillus thermoaerophilus]|uniref:TraR/DksA C4-type zinc finger protein n=1 Tax=Paenibacillus thermoaerophilus TaxID=1215385 RepID=A0ABW2V368_9BACL|nr:TraR/DksA C4-type zinc finger protein [Paenibacillus thermoaerophilus]TMV19096.1 molecular chaperone DnaK [Paenibacillus thermoaerophilus]